MQSLSTSRQVVHTYYAVNKSSIYTPLNIAHEHTKLKTDILAKSGVMAEEFNTVRVEAKQC
jgi:hypothetical protein